MGRLYAQDDPPLPLLEERLCVLAAVLGERHLLTSRCTARRLVCRNVRAQVGVPHGGAVGVWPR